MAAPVIAVMGPTAAGKTAFAQQLAELVDGELISVDSALIYRGLDVGAAKPDYPHHLIHIRDPSESYTAADFARDARECIDEIRQRGRQPILVGGSMLYFRALMQGLDDLPESDPNIRNEIEQEALQKGWPALHSELAEVDPDTAARLHPNHSQRISRALEVHRISGVPMSEWLQASTELDDERYLSLALSPRERRHLHARIEARLDTMYANGLVEEVQHLFDRGDLNPDRPAIRAVGYRQTWAYLAGETSLQDSRERILAATRQLAKRQLTWLRGWPSLTWLLTDESAQRAAVETDDPALEALAVRGEIGLDVIAQELARRVGNF